MPLFINGTRVNKISGPISMHILTPKKNDLFPNLPVYMLFGDYHESSDNLCEDNSPEILDVYSTDFLGLLNNLVKPNGELIDFYIEGGDFHNMVTAKPFDTKKYPMRMVWNLYSQCYKNVRSENKLAEYEHQTDCNKISNVRFQSGDPRYFKYAKKYEKLLLLCNMQNFLNLFKSKEDLNPDTFVSNLNLFIQTNPGGDCIEKLLYTSFSSYVDIGPEIFSEEGLIHKQLKKFNPAQRRIMTDKIIRKYYTFSHQKHNEAVARYPLIENIYNELINIISKLQFNIHPENVDMKSLKYLQDNWESLEIYRDLLVYKYSIVADIYTLCRSFKYLNSQENPIMNILYFGNAHTNNVVHLLTKITHLYDQVEIKSVKTYDTISRCVEIKNDIDLDKILNDAREIRNTILPVPKVFSFKRQPSPVRTPSVRTPSVRKQQKQEEICSSFKKSGKKCVNKAKPNSQLCGVHKKCKTAFH